MTQLKPVYGTVIDQFDKIFQNVHCL